MSWSFFVKLFIHPFVMSSIYGWHHTRKKTLAKINNPPLRMCHYLGKACPAPRYWLSRDWVSLILKRRSSQGTMSTNVCSYSCLSGICNENQQKSRSDTKQCWNIFIVCDLFSWSAVCCYLTGHKQCKHQDFQRPRSWWMHAKCDI